MKRKAISDFTAEEKEWMDTIFSISSVRTVFKVILFRFFRVEME